MAGNSRSGNRTGLPRAAGAGRKAKTQRQRWLSGQARDRGLSLVEKSPKAAEARVQAVHVVATVGATGEVPAMLSEPERAYWHLWAPLAVENGTLTDSTRPGMVLLCQTAADIARVRADIDTRGMLFEKVDNVGGEEVRDLKRHPLWPDLRGLRQQLRDLLARYGLTGAGRAVEKVSKDLELEAERAELRRILAIR